MTTVMTIVVATTNPGKLGEIRALLGGLPVEVLSAAEALGAAPDVVEDCESFEANALKKARAVAEQAMMVTLADDSGLEVDALGGRPGVRSARFASKGATDAENNAELLRQMGEIEDGARGARFRCAIALVDPWAEGEAELVVAGSCEGSIAHQPTGTGGFGYDPLFVLAGGQLTMAQLAEDEKNSISHRARALASLQPVLYELVQRRLTDAARVLDQQPASTGG